MVLESAASLLDVWGGSVPTDRETFAPATQVNARLAFPIELNMYPYTLAALDRQEKVHERMIHGLTPCVSAHVCHFPCMYPHSSKMRVNRTAPQPYIGCVEL